MSVPMRKEDFVEEDLTTADLAQGKRPTGAGNPLKDDALNEERAMKDRPGPVLAERPESKEVREDASGAKTTDRQNTAGTPSAAAAAPLFLNNELEELRNRWNGVQTAFVDEPRRAVEQADGLVASAMKRLAEVFAEERSKLEHQWDRGDNVSTEDLRIALQRYRSFFHRLLSI
jgi:hypothetical protein